MKKFLFACISVAAIAATPALAANTESVCELGQRLATSGDQSSDVNIELVWRGRPYTMQRVETSTGANRFENNASGLTWISIPTKSMLLDTKRGVTLANECKTAAQGRFAK